MKRLTIFLCLLGFSLQMFSQEEKAYSIKLNGKYEFSETSDEGVIVDMYTVFEDSVNLPKYLAYVMISDVNDQSLESIDIHSEEVQLEMTRDLNCKILESNQAKYADMDGVELKVDYSNRNLPVLGCLFMSIHKNKAVRILVMMPTEEHLKKYYSEFQELVKSIELNT